MTTRPRYTIEARAGECTEHGQFGNALIEQFGAEPVWFGCPRCAFDRRHAADLNVRTAGALAHAERQMNERLLDSAIPLRFQKSTFDNWRAENDPTKSKVWNMATGFVEAFSENFAVGRSMMLLGTVGTGKTHLAAAMLQQAIRNFGESGLIGRYVTAGGIIRSVKETFGARNKTESDVYAELLKPHLLVIDEVGVQHGTDFERQVLFEVINGRYERMSPTVVVSNLGVPELRQCMGDRAVDRLRDRGGLIGVFRWPSARGEA
jgi:DNA replication protein DnaC